MKFSKIERRVLIILIIALAISSGILLTSAFYPGSHSLFLNKAADAYPTAAAEFCVKCHPDKVNKVDSSVHRNAGCICHGYNPNLTDEYNIDLAHNLTKNIYCTNCHSNYSIDTGDIVIHGDPARGNVSGINQSAHYLINSAGDKMPVYARAKQFFVNRT
ncbi:Uncharacterised protein [uncultured archaeon]|nr:Uncharacterised protein [uncultured archaeon]